MVFAVLPTEDWLGLGRGGKRAPTLCGVCLVTGGLGSTLGDVESGRVGGDVDDSAGEVTGPAVANESPGGDSLAPVGVAAVCGGTVGAPTVGPGAAVDAASMGCGSGDCVGFTHIQ